MIIEFNNPFNKIYDFIDNDIKDYLSKRYITFSNNNIYFYKAYHGVYNKIFNNLLRTYILIGSQIAERN